MSKKAIDLMSVNLNKTVVSDKFDYNEDCFKYLISYQKGEIVHYVLFYFKWMGI